MCYGKSETLIQNMMDNILYTKMAIKINDHDIVYYVKILKKNPSKILFGIPKS